MGYFTTHKLSLLYGNSDQYDHAELLKDLLLLQQEAQAVSDYDFELHDAEHCIMSDSVKWYDCIDHMLDLSKKHPDWLILVEGIGEEQGDVWKAYFKNGKHTVLCPQVVFPDFTESMLH
jgi:hypothetical protein